MWILFAVIVLGNSAVLISLYLNKRKSRMNFFIKQLAIAGKFMYPFHLQAFTQIPLLMECIDIESILIEFRKVFSNNSSRRRKKKAFPLSWKISINQQ